MSSRRWQKQFIALVIFLGVAGFLELLIYQNQRHDREVLERNTLSQAGEVRGILQAELNSTLHLTTGLVTFIQANNGQIVHANMAPWLESMIAQGNYIRNIGLAPGNRLSYIFPLEGNEQALGLYYPDNPRQWPAVERIIKEGKPKLDGPLTLLQGGQGLIYRAPVYLAPDHSYWGLVSTVIDADKVLAVVEGLAQSLKLNLTLYKRTESGDRDVFFATAASSAPSELATLEVRIPGATWYLDAAPANYEPPVLTLSQILAVVLALLLSTLSFLFLRAREQHQQTLRDKQDVEQRFASAFQLAPIGMLIVDSQERVETCNQALADILGFSVAQLNGIAVTDLMREDSTADAQSFLMGHGQRTTLEMCLRDSQGNDVDVVCHRARLVQNNGGTDTGSSLIQVVDVREHKRLERLKTQFVSTVSHELRTPITAISGSLGILANTDLQSKDPGKAHELVSIAMRNSKRLELLINDLLDMEKISAGQLTVRSQPVNPKTVLSQTLATMRPYAEQYQVNLILETPEALPTVTADESRLLQVLANFTSNAIKFSPRHGTVTLGATLVSNRVIFRVIDHGPGIPEGFRQQIFNRFSQADGSDTKSRGGTGLGLAISKELVEKMHGEIGYHSEPGVRTEFFAGFPVET